jgi:hypothetical protein
MKNELHYMLVSEEGCIMAYVDTDTLRNARGTFAVSYSGKYRIVWVDKYQRHQEKNVRL